MGIAGFEKDHIEAAKEWDQSGARGKAGGRGWSFRTTDPGRTYTMRFVAKSVARKFQNDRKKEGKGRQLQNCCGKKGHPSNKGTMAVQPGKRKRTHK